MVGPLPAGTGQTEDVRRRDPKFCKSLKNIQTLATRQNYSQLTPAYKLLSYPIFQFKDL